MARILVVHGAGMNMRGKVQTEIFGPMTLPEYDERIRGYAAELGLEVEIFQSNHEGALLDRLQARMDDCEGCVINPGALTHYSIALHDCLKAMPFPTVEVHLSNIAKRESFRHHSFVSPVAEGTIAGLGWRGYLLALRWLAETASEREA